MPPNNVHGTHFKPSEYVQCKVEVDSGEKKGGLHENARLVLAKSGIGFEQALKRS